MSEWFEIKNQENIEISEDGKMLEILIGGIARIGNISIVVPIKFIKNILEVDKIGGKA